MAGYSITPPNIKIIKFAASGIKPKAEPKPLVITKMAAPYPAITPQLGKRSTLLLRKTVIVNISLLVSVIGAAFYISLKLFLEEGGLKVCLQSF